MRARACACVRACVCVCVGVCVCVCVCVCVVSGSLDGTCKLWDRKTGRSIMTLDGGNGEYILDVRWSPQVLSVLVQKCKY